MDLSVPRDGPSSQNISAVSAWLKRRRWFVLVVITPTILSAVYFGLIASDVYVSESRFVIKSANQKQPQLSTLANLIQTTGLSSGQEQTNEILDYVRSRDALKALQSSAKVSERYGAPNGDALSRFPGVFSDTSFESLYKFYGKMVDAKLDNETGAAVLTVKAFSPQDAYTINASLLRMSEGLINQLNNRAQSRAILEAQKQVDLAMQRAKTARVAITQYRNSQSLLDPTKQAGGVLEVSNGLVAARAELQSRLQTMQQVAPQNPSIPALRQRIEALSSQIALQDGRVAGTPTGLASKLGGYEELVVEQEFATESLNAANAALVQATNEAQRQKFYLERIVDPNVPDRALLPKRIWNIIVTAAAMLCLYFIGWMLVVGILEHAPDD
nr:capsule biosynthesis protein [Novosphingobium sp. B1]